MYIMAVYSLILNDHYPRKILVSTAKWNEQVCMNYELQRSEATKQFVNNLIARPKNNQAKPFITHFTPDFWKKKG